MKEQYVAGLSEGERVDSLFALAGKELRSARTGQAYLSMTLSDRTGRTGAVWFRPDREAAAAPVGSVMRVRGLVTTFRGSRRVSVESMVPAPSYDPSDMLPCGYRDRAELEARFDRLRAEIGDAGLRAVVDAVFSDRVFWDRFAACPGSRSHHHPYLLGLLEHTVTVASLARYAGRVYEQVDGDLLLAAALLHDIGKVDELDWHTSIEHSEAGRMLGHVVLGERRVWAAMTALCDTVTEDVRLRLSHILLTHHGELEWGSPKPPVMLESVVLHFLDNLDSKAAGFLEAVSPARLAEETWTDGSNMFGRSLRVPVAPSSRHGRSAREGGAMVESLRR